MMAVRHTYLGTPSDHEAKLPQRHQHKVIFCKIHDERLSREVEFYATSKERDGLDGRLKAKKRLETLLEDLKTEYPTIF